MSCGLEAYRKEIFIGTLVQKGQAQEGTWQNYKIMKATVQENLDQGSTL